MTKLEMFRMIGESYAKAHQFDNRLFKAELYFRMIASEMYPLNEHRLDWAISNMLMFWTQESERILIMKKLQNVTTGDDILEEIRRRKAYDEAQCHK